MSLPFRKLALGAGGVKGILHIGALQELSKFQKLEFPDGIYGCSIGSVIGTYLSFGLPIDDKTVELTKKYLSMDKVIGKPNFHDLTNALSSKGLFNMDSFETSLVDMFNEVDIDIKSKRIGDTEMPLYIVASNLTKGVPTVFSKDVPILDALKCSCCIPGIFKPQELYGQIYIDGGMFTPLLTTLAPDALSFSLEKQTKTRITPKTIEMISPIQFMKDVYSMAAKNFIAHQKTDLTINLEYPDLHSDSDLDEFDVEDILNTAQLLTRGFLRSKGFCKESAEV
jgi:hypothetical protein